MNKKYIFPLVLVFSVLTLVGFIAFVGSQKTANSTKLITTSFYPLTYITKEIVGDQYIVQNITPAGSEPHDYEPTSQEIKAVYDSRVFIYHGTNLESWANELAPKVDKAGVITLKTSKIVNFITENSDKDPHFWLDPILMKDVVNKVSNTLTENTAILTSKPEPRISFQNNTNSLLQKLDELDNIAKEKFRDCRQIQFITSHSAFNYFAKRYGLESIPINGLSPDKEPSTQELADLVKEVKSKNIKFIYTETLISPKLSETLASEAGAKTLVLNPLEGLTKEEQDQGLDYITIMKQNINNLAIGLECK